MTNIKIEKVNLTILTAIVSLTIIEVVALIKGIDGQILSLVVGAIAGLGGLIGGHKIRIYREK